MMEHHDQWTEIQNDLQSAAQVQIPRIVMTIDPECSYELHIFADASAKVYTAVAYIRAYDLNSQTYHVGLIYSKNRIVKPNSHTIPTLELLAVVLATCLLTFLRKTFKCEFARQFIWSDSTTILAWIKNSKKILPLFIERRIKVIRELPGVKFCYVPSS